MFDSAGLGGWVEGAMKLASGTLVSSKDQRKECPLFVSREANAHSDQAEVEPAASRSWPIPWSVSRYFRCGSPGVVVTRPSISSRSRMSFALVVGGSSVNQPGGNARSN